MITQATSGKTGLLKYDRRIIIVTDGQGYMDTEDIDQIAAKLKEDKYEVTLL
jgi:ATP-dependent DNA helicase 2 subunit 2